RVQKTSPWASGAVPLERLHGLEQLGVGERPLETVGRDGEAALELVHRTQHDRGSVPAGADADRVADPGGEGETRDLRLAAGEIGVLERRQVLAQGELRMLVQERATLLRG